MIRLFLQIDVELTQEEGLFIATMTNQVKGDISSHQTLLPLYALVDNGINPSGGNPTHYLANPSSNETL